MDETNNQNQEITVAYKWTAKPGKGDELKAMYKQVVQEATSSEPGTLRFDVYEVKNSEDIIILDVFKDAAALGQHLGVTAQKYFPKLVELAVPGPFFFFGNVPDELMQAANGMNMGAVFATHAFGIERD